MPKKPKTVRQIEKIHNKVLYNLQEFSDEALDLAQLGYDLAKVVRREMKKPKERRNWIDLEIAVESYDSFYGR